MGRGGVSAVTQSVTPAVELTRFKVHHLCGAETAPSECAKAFGLGYVERPEGESTRSNPLPACEEVAPAADSARAGIPPQDGEGSRGRAFSVVAGGAASNSLWMACLFCEASMRKIMRGREDQALALAGWLTWAMRAWWLRKLSEMRVWSSRAESRSCLSRGSRSSVGRWSREGM